MTRRNRKMIKNILRAIRLVVTEPKVANQCEARAWCKNGALWRKTTRKFLNEWINRDYLLIGLFFGLRSALLVRCGSEIIFLLFAKQTSSVKPINAAEMRSSIDAVMIERNTKIIAIINSLAVPRTTRWSLFGRTHRYNSIEKAHTELSALIFLSGIISRHW